MGSVGRVIANELQTSRSREGFPFFEPQTDPSQELLASVVIVGIGEVASLMELGLGVKRIRELGEAAPPIHPAQQFDVLLRHRPRSIPPSPRQQRHGFHEYHPFSSGLALPALTIGISSR
jgi:hypothetical protein